MINYYSEYRTINQYSYADRSITVKYTIATVYTGSIGLSMYVKTVNGGKRTGVT